VTKLTGTLAGPLVPFTHRPTPKTKQGKSKMFKTLSLITIIAATTISQATSNPFDNPTYDVSRVTSDTMSGSLNPGFFDTYRWNLLEGNQSITLVGSGSGSDFDLYVYDGNTGDLIAKDDDNTNVCMVSFYSKFDGAKARVKIVNNGRRWGTYAAELKLED
jgi:hypothetical protein